MANNRMYFRCDCCGDEILVAIHFGEEWSFVEYVDGFLLEHAFCNGWEAFGNGSHFSIVYEDSKIPERLEKGEKG